MKFSIGDAVLMKRTGEEGRIVSFLSRTMLEVEVNGVHFPVYEDEVDHPYLKWFTEKKEAQKKKSTNVEIIPEKIKERKARLAQGIYLSFMPVFLADSFEDIVTHFRIFLINEAATPLFFVYEVRNAAGRLVFSHQAMLHAFANVYLHPQTLEEMNDQPRFHWTLSEGAGGVNASENKGILRIKPAKLFDNISRILEANEPSFNYLLADDAQGIPKIKQAIALNEKPDMLPSRDHPPAVPEWKPKEVLDLHIEALVEHSEELSFAEILHIQLNALEYHIDMAIAHNQQYMVVIHGIGTGKLKEEVHRLLQSKSGVASFENKWHGLYGFGATIVDFQS